MRYATSERFTSREKLALRYADAIMYDPAQADDALDLIATQADLRVVRQGKTFLITSPEHASVLFEERMEKERRQIELERLRQTPFGPLGIPGGFGCLPGFNPGM